MEEYLWVLKRAELDLMREIESDRMALLDEDGLLALHKRIRRARNKHVTNYRRKAARSVAEAKARGAARPKGSKDRLRAEAFEEALSRVSERLAEVAHEQAEQLKAERLALAREGRWTGPESRSASRPGRSPTRAAPAATRRPREDRSAMHPVSRKERAARPSAIRGKASTAIDRFGGRSERRTLNGGAVDLDIDGIAQAVGTGALPPSATIDALLTAAFRRAEAHHEGAVADYIPILAQADAEAFGLCVVDVTGGLHGLGALGRGSPSSRSRRRSSMPCVVRREFGHQRRPGRRRSEQHGLAFNSVMAIELNDGHPMNPMVNAGAIATTALMPGATRRTAVDRHSLRTGVTIRGPAARDR